MRGLNIKVNTFIMGTQKGGTTALFNFLAYHPDVATATKEPHFFDSRAVNDDASVSIDYSEYHARFASTDGSCLLDATPIYMYWHPVRDALYRYNPNAKLIFLLRRPWERAHSQWSMNVATGEEELSFDDALEREAEWSRHNHNKQNRTWSYVDRGYYAKQIRRLHERFELSQMLFLTTDQLQHQHIETLDKVCDFVGVSRFGQYPTAQTILPNVGSVEVPKATQETQDRLVELFKPDLEDLVELSGLELAEWFG